MAADRNFTLVISAVAVAIAVAIPESTVDDNTGGNSRPRCATVVPLNRAIHESIENSPWSPEAPKGGEKTAEEYEREAERNMQAKINAMLGAFGSAPAKGAAGR